jgi:hypothetical protein
MRTRATRRGGEEGRREGEARRGGEKGRREGEERRGGEKGRREGEEKRGGEGASPRHGDDKVEVVVPRVELQLPPRGPDGRRKLHQEAALTVAEQEQLPLDVSQVQDVLRETAARRTVHALTSARRRRR